MSNPSGKRADTRKISEMRNLGPACESDLNAAGIRTAGDLIAIGVEAAFLAMLSARMKQGRSAKCCNAAYLYALHGAVHDIDWRRLPEKMKAEYKNFAAEVRQSGQFHSGRKRGIATTDERAAPRISRIKLDG